MALLLGNFLFVLYGATLGIFFVCFVLRYSWAILGFFFFLLRYSWAIFFLLYGVALEQFLYLLYGVRLGHFAVLLYGVTHGQLFCFICMA